MDNIRITSGEPCAWGGATQRLRDLPENMAEGFGKLMYDVANFDRLPDVEKGEVLFAGASMAAPYLGAIGTVTTLGGDLVRGGVRITVNDIGATGVGRYQAGSIGLRIERGVANSELTIASNSANGNPAAIARGIGDLNSRQTAVLEQLSGVGSRTITSKAIGQNDLAD